MSFGTLNKRYAEHNDNNVIGVEWVKQCSTSSVPLGVKGMLKVRGGLTEPLMPQKIKNCAATLGLWSKSGSQRVSFRSALLSLFESFHEMHLFNLTNMKSFRTGLKASLVGWR
jgi:hypothetical protein